MEKKIVFNVDDTQKHPSAIELLRKKFEEQGDFKLFIEIGEKIERLFEMCMKPKFLVLSESRYRQLCYHQYKMTGTLAKMPTVVQLYGYELYVIVMKDFKENVMVLPDAEQTFINIDKIFS